VDRSIAPANPVRTLRTRSAAETRALGRALGMDAVPGTVLALVGPLGAGKTQLAKGVAEGLGVRSVVNSPTFVLMNEHEGRLRLFHIDAYRLDDPQDAVAAGLLDERQAGGVTVVEWADRLEGWLPDARLEIRLAPVAEDDRSRTVGWQALGPDHERLAERVFGADR
jgi:tRNA threonylcarbamoyladenosine biosynthesis protein TsaE